jgi:hypothetical protein
VPACLGFAHYFNQWYLLSCSSAFPAAERASVLLGKAAHYGLLLVLPTLLHGWKAALVGAAAYRWGHRQGRRVFRVLGSFGRNHIVKRF